MGGIFAHIGVECPRCRGDDTWTCPHAGQVWCERCNLYVPLVEEKEENCNCPKTKKKKNHFLLKFFQKAADKDIVGRETRKQKEVVMSSLRNLAYKVLTNRTYAINVLCAEVALVFIALLGYVFLDRIEHPAAFFAQMFVSALTFFLAIDTVITASVVMRGRK